MKQLITFCLATAILLGGTFPAAAEADNPLLGMKRFSDLKKIGKVAPRRSENIEASPWGVQFNKHDLPMEDMEMFLEKAAESGVKWARVETRSYPFEYEDVKEKGYYRWNEFDKIIDGLSQRKIEIFVTINIEPFRGLEREIINSEVEYESAALDLKALNAWLEYVRAVVERYHDRVTYWEIHNEPKATPTYGETVKAASRVIKEIDPTAKVIAGSIARVNVESVRLLLEEYGVGPYIDVITYHPYNEFPEASKNVFLQPVVGGYTPASAPVSDMFALIEKEERPIALWQGEAGYPSSEYTTSWKGRGPWGENIQAKWILRRFLVDFSMNIPVNIYFLLREPPEDGRVNAKGLLVYGTWEEKAGFRALQHITSVFDQRLMKSKSVKAAFEFLDEGSFYGIAGENLKREKAFYDGSKGPIPIQVFGLTGSEGDAIVYYTPWRMTEYIKPAKVNVRIKDVSIKDPVLVDLLTGQVYQPETLTEGNELILKAIPLTDYPFAVISKQNVTKK